MIDQISEDIARLKNRLESCRDRAYPAGLEGRYCPPGQAREDRAQGPGGGDPRASRSRRAARSDLQRRGAGMPTAVAILVRMPEIGQLTREQAAALAGLAPYDDDSGEHVGVRHIDGGRERLRRALYTAALPASFRWNPQPHRPLQTADRRRKGAQARAHRLCQKAAHLRQHRRRTRHPWGHERPPTVAASALPQTG